MARRRRGRRRRRWQYDREDGDASSVAVDMRSGEVEDGLRARVVTWGVRGARIDAPHEERAGVGLEGWRIDGGADNGGAGSTTARTATPAGKKDRNGSIRMKCH